ncbi:MAG TPA: hypothetical protein VGF69_16790 [Thermoanaerobaculia bacterium]
MPNEETLFIEFRGVCTHFHCDVLPGIPHRVVIPDGNSKRGGLLALTDEAAEDWIPYELEPHRTIIKMEGRTFTYPGLVNENELFTRSALRIENAVGCPIDYDPTFECVVPSLTEYVDNFTYATSVVMEGRASAYFDFHSGVKFSAYKIKQEIRVKAEVQTYGKPRLRITAFSAGDPRGRTQCFELPGDNQKNPLVIANEGSPAAYRQNNGKYDFILHYLTERGGIPRFLKKPLPGMPCSMDGGTPDEQGYHASDLGAGCSDSRYP